MMYDWVCKGDVSYRKFKNVVDVLFTGVTSVRKISV